MADLCHLILNPIVRGLNREAGRSKVASLDKILKMSKRLPVSYLIFRVILIVAALVGAVTGKENIAVGTYFLQHEYCYLKYVVLCATWARVLFLASNLMDATSKSKSESSSHTGNTNTKIKAFGKQLLLV